MGISRADCQRLDEEDPLRALREQFELPEGIIYLDGNSLGALPRTAAARVQAAVTEEWGRGLIRSWNTAGWITLPARVGDKIARLIGADPGEVVVADSTSVNLYKVLSAALAMAAADVPGQRVILSERQNFPTDLYIAQSLAQEHGYELALCDAPEEITARLGEGGVAVLMLTHVNYRTGRMHDLKGLTDLAHEHGTMVLWDLAHSAGAVPLALKADGADFAVGCGYKYLNGGPGAPAFAWVHPRHADRFEQPLSGWMGHAEPFAFTPDYRPAPGIARYLCGTPAVLAMTALECGVDTVLAVPGMEALRKKSLALTDLFMELVETRCAGHGLALATPRAHADRGSQVSYTREDGGYAIMQALIARNVIGDFRAPDLLRFGFTPLYVCFADVWDAVEALREVLETGAWREPRFQARAAVT
jgi:kynureninase